MLFRSSGKWFKKITQSVVILPHFISWTVVALLCEALLKTNNGFINNILATLGFERINFYQNADVWPALTEDPVVISPPRNKNSTRCRTEVFTTPF